MALTSGFYDSEGHDRKYSAMQFGTIFDGVINDGVFEHYEKAFIVKDTGGLNQNAVIIQPGRAWFNHTWTYNDADLLFTMPEQSLALDRIDALVLRIDHLARENTFEVVKGVESSTPEKPTIVNHGPDIFDYPLAYVYRTADVSEINARDIENTVGTSECPFSTGLIEGITTDELVAQWSAQWADWSMEKRTEFIEWFNNLQYVLDGDVAGHLQNEIDKLENTLEHIFYVEYNNTPTGAASRNYSEGVHIYFPDNDSLYITLSSILEDQLFIPDHQLGAEANISYVEKPISEEIVTQVNGLMNEVKGELTANGNRMYMDYKNGKYGVNTSPTRGADTFIPFNDGKVYVYGATNGNTTFKSPVSGQIYCYLMSCAAQIQWYQEDTSVSITSRVLKNGTVICNCSGSQHDGDRDAWVQLSNSYKGTVNEGDTIQIQMSGGGNYMGRASQVVVIVDGSIIDV